MDILKILYCTLTICCDVCIIALIVGRLKK